LFFRAPFPVLAGSLFLIGLFSCKGKDAQSADPGKLLAEAAGQQLHEADIDPGLVPPGVSSLDSAHIMDVYIENWVRKQLLLAQAQAYASDNQEIDRLVKEYYNSLIIQQYENALVREKLDSNITVQEYQDYYEQHKGQYLIEDTYVRAYFVKVANNTPGLSDLRAVWLPGVRLDYNKIFVFCNANRGSTDFLLEENKWVMLDILKQKLPADVVSPGVLKGDDLIVSDDNHTYFMRIFEYAEAGTIAPISFVMKDIRDILLYQRRSALIEQVTKELYQKAQQEGNLKIH
jgi:hypothetical protein